MKLQILQKKVGCTYLYTFAKPFLILLSNKKIHNTTLHFMCYQNNYINKIIYFTYLIKIRKMHIIYYIYFFLSRNCLFF